MAPYGSAHRQTPVRSMDALMMPHTPLSENETLTKKGRVHPVSQRKAPKRDRKASEMEYRRQNGSSEAVRGGHSAQGKLVTLNV